MNGIIHPCARPEGGEKPNCEEDIFANVFEYTDKVIRLCRPRKIIYMAIDGVAPRAKLNQQRSRRFRKALEEEERITRESELRTHF
jgi:5'-3' exoribonuclease 2